MLQSNQKIIRHKVGLLNLAEELGNVSKACQVMGLSRDTFYRYRDAVEEGGVEALLERTRRVPNPKNRVDLETEEVVVAYAVEYPAHGQVRPATEKCRIKSGLIHMKRESLPFRPSGLGFTSQSRAGQMSTLGPKSHLSGGRAPIAQHQNFYGARS